MIKRGDSLTIEQRALCEGLTELARKKGLSIFEGDFISERYFKLHGRVSDIHATIERAHRNAAKSKLVFKYQFGEPAYA
ncbi:MAG: hypothetical protein Q8L27_03805 [archaeon]|nr:hypothetical protein [archaeon]